MEQALRTALVAALGGLMLTLAGACSDDDDDPVPAMGTVEGDYTIAITNRENGCNFDDWTEGESTSGINLALSVDDGDAVGEVTGEGSFLVLTAVLGPGGNVLEGTATGANLELMRYGTRAFDEGDCIYTLTATVSAAVDGDVITGSIRYTAATNDNPDCAGLEGCISRQEFNGTRPPS
jgi:hypothetical protein